MVPLCMPSDIAKVKMKMKVFMCALGPREGEGGQTRLPWDAMSFAHWFGDFRDIIVPAEQVLGEKI